MAPSAHLFSDAFRLLRFRRPIQAHPKSPGPQRGRLRGHTYCTGNRRCSCRSLRQRARTTGHHRVFLHEYRSAALPSAASASSQPGSAFDWLKLRLPVFHHTRITSAVVSYLQLTTHTPARDAFRFYIFTFVSSCPFPVSMRRCSPRLPHFFH